MKKLPDDFFSPLDLVGEKLSLRGSKTNTMSCFPSVCEELKIHAAEGSEPEEGGRCPECYLEKLGRLKLSRSKNCSCFINPPCSSCMAVYLYCPECGWEPDINSEGKDR